LVRNRIIAALSSATLVVEAALRSGSLSTANWANALGRQVWGVPGPLSSATSAGVHAGIAEGDMSIVADLSSMLKTLEPESASLANQLTLEELAILNALERSVLSTDDIWIHLQRNASSMATAQELLACLTLLELQGSIRKTAAGWKRA
jgi:DNA processing protein